MPPTALTLPESPQKEAERLRTDLWPQGYSPLDPVRIAMRLGIRVKQAELPEDVSGGLFKEKGKDPVILLQASDSESRKRFTCAHEIGHYILAAGNDAIECVDYRNTHSSESTDPAEIFANGFAANLLMPEDEVRALAKTMPAWALAAEFGVSAEAMKMRLGTLGYDVE